jgi:hypothetical protein
MHESADVTCHFSSVKTMCEIINNANAGGFALIRTPKPRVQGLARRQNER